MLIMKPSNTERAEVGRVGEDTACRFLVKRGFSIVERNYLRKWGEIDIVARKKGVVRFVEVKTVSRNLGKGVIRETGDGYRAEDNLHAWKLKRLSRVIQTYILEKDIKGEWQFDVVTVLLDTENRLAKVEFLENLVL